MEATIHDFTQYRGGYGRLTPDERAEAMEVALRAADEKRRQLADPEGQEYVYLYRLVAGAVIWPTFSEDEAKRIARDPRFRVERALVGDWERV